MSLGQGHYIKRNEANRIPSRHVVIDAEARTEYGKLREAQTWRLAVACFMHVTDRGNWHEETREYSNPDELWKDVTEFCRPKRRTVVWAHNISYDLRVTDALRALERHGWCLEDIKLSNNGTWGRWRNAGLSLVAVDSASIWPCSLATIAATFGYGKLPLPDDENDERWMARCKRDVDILSRAVREYLTWLKADDMGNWAVTGAGQSFAAWRHKHMTHRVLVADDFGAREAERRAMWTGRCEAWSYGEDKKARVYDYDFQNAYARICLDTEVPVRQIGVRQSVTLERALELTKSFAVLAEVEVTTDVPVVPTTVGEHMAWPVGSFSTTLWDPELRLLSEAGATVTITRLWLYQKAPALKQWAEWILSELAAPEEQCPAWRKLILKHWSRTTIGRFAMRYKGWELIGESEAYDVGLTNGQDDETGNPVSYMQIGHQVYEPGEEKDAHDAAPMITGYVMSEARRRLWEACNVIGHEHVLYMDTDSLLVTHKGHRIAEENDEWLKAHGLRLKGKYTGWTIGGPRQVVVGGQPRISGVPKTAKQTGPWTFEGHVWRSIGESIRHGEPDRVTIRPQTFTVHCIDRRRSHGPGKRTTPIGVSQNGCSAEAA